MFPLFTLVIKTRENFMLTPFKYLRKLSTDFNNKLFDSRIRIFSQIRTAINIIPYPDSGSLALPSPLYVDPLELETDKLWMQFLLILQDLRSSVKISVQFLEGRPPAVDVNLDKIQ